MLKIEFTGDAKDYILHKNAGSITVEMMSICYGGQFNKPVASTGKPTSPEKYDLVDASGFKVYIFKGAEAEPDGIKISLEAKLKGFKRLCVAGLVYDKLT
jgi:hypothetical protein